MGVRLEGRAHEVKHAWTRFHQYSHNEADTIIITQLRAYARKTIMAVITTCIVTSSEEGKGAFGVRADTDEGVYFPVGMSDHLELEEFEQVEVVLVKNEREGTPWRAIRARRLPEAVQTNQTNP